MMWYKADGSDGFTTEMETLVTEPLITPVTSPVFLVVNTEMETLATEPLMTPVTLPVFLVMNKDKTEINFGVCLFGRWFKAFVDGSHYLDVEYVKPITDDFMIPSKDWKEHYKAEQAACFF